MLETIDGGSERRSPSGKFLLKNYQNLLFFSKIFLKKGWRFINPGGFINRYGVFEELAIVVASILDLGKFWLNIEIQNPKK